MAFQMTYPKTLTLEQLNQRMRNDEGLAGSLTRIGHNELHTLAEFDEGAPPDGALVLVASDDEEAEGRTLICKGEVWIEGEPTIVSAFRAD
jgi:hypothetical protein